MSNELIQVEVAINFLLVEEVPHNSLETRDTLPKILLLKLALQESSYQGSNNMKSLLII